MGSAEEDVLDTSLLSFDGDFNKQVEELLAHVRLTRDEVENLQCLLDDLTQALSYNWPNTKVHPFGSVVTGLGIKTSDVDCYIQVPPGLADYYTPQTLIERAKYILNRDKSRFTKVFAISTAKVPIIKFVHAQTGFNCDINFSSLNGVRNSKLIACLLTLESRALPLAVILKYWSKVYNFTGTNLMPNYALTMMVIFYLQVKSVLPSVAELQRQTQSHWVDNWDTAFNDELAYVHDNNESLYALLGGFFDYYKSFDYTQLVISPYLGRHVKRTQLGDLNNLPTEYGLYKNNVQREVCDVIKLDTAICIQDPFEHSRNCAMAVSAKLFNKIQAHIELAFNTFHEKPCDGFLRELFTMHVPNVSKLPRKGQPNFRKRNKGIHKNQRHVQKAQFRKYFRQQDKYKCFRGPFL